MAHNVPAMISTGTKSSELPFKHLVKTFYFVLSFLLKPNQKIWRTLKNTLNFGLSTKPRINYSPC